jgi:hypothetical protein
VLKRPDGAVLPVARRTKVGLARRRQAQAENLLHLAGEVSVAVRRRIEAGKRLRAPALQRSDGTILGGAQGAPLLGDALHHPRLLLAGAGALFLGTGLVEQGCGQALDLPYPLRRCVREPAHRLLDKARPLALHTLETGDQLQLAGETLHDPLVGGDPRRRLLARGLRPPRLGLAGRPLDVVDLAPAQRAPLCDQLLDPGGIAALGAQRLQLADRLGLLVPDLLDPVNGQLVELLLELALDAGDHLGDPLGCSSPLAGVGLPLLGREALGLDARPRQERLKLVAQALHAQLLGMEEPVGAAGAHTIEPRFRLQQLAVGGHDLPRNRAAAEDPGPPFEAAAHEIDGARGEAGDSGRPADLLQHEPPGEGEAIDRSLQPLRLGGARTTDLPLQLGQDRPLRRGDIACLGHRRDRLALALGEGDADPAKSAQPLGRVLQRAPEELRLAPQVPAEHGRQVLGQAQGILEGLARD